MPNLKLKIKNFDFLIMAIIFFNILNFSSANSDTIKVKSWTNIYTDKSFPINKYTENTQSNSSGIQLKLLKGAINSQISVNFKDKKKVNFDQSYFEYNINTVSLGAGKINRSWSFSPNTSLILSTNARPAKSVYLKLKKNKSKNPIFSWIGPWSFETFNSVLSNSTGPNDTMLLGFRTVNEPIKNLKIELVKTSQWGGNGHNSNISALGAAFLGNTNESVNSNINQLAGFGISYSSHINERTFNIYSQFIGEDEAGNLPSCFMKLYGTEFNLGDYRYPTNFGIEVVDTRIDTSTTGYCGPNTAYNNGTYKYINYNTSLGAPVDTEGKSVMIWGSSKLSKNITLNYSTKKVLINDLSWPDHRLSTTQQKGYVTALGTSWVKDAIKIKSEIIYQDFSLNKAKIFGGVSLNLTARISF